MNKRNYVAPTRLHPEYRLSSTSFVEDYDEFTETTTTMVKLPFRDWKLYTRALIALDEDPKGDEELESIQRWKKAYPHVPLEIDFEGWFSDSEDEDFFVFASVACYVSMDIDEHAMVIGRLKLPLSDEDRQYLDDRLGVQTIFQLYYNGNI